MKKIKKWFSEHFGTKQIKADLESVEKERLKIDLIVDDIRTTLDGEDRFFLKICDSEDPEEKECPPDHENFK